MQANQLEKKDAAAKDAAIAATAGVPESEKATGARKELDLGEAKEGKKAALFQRVALSQSPTLPEGYKTPKGGIVRPNDASGRD